MESNPPLIYAQNILEGRIPAGPYVRSAMARHISDLERKELEFDWLAARQVCLFIERFRLSQGDFAGEFLRLHPLQKFIIGSVYGWYYKDLFNGRRKRRYERCYIEMGKGQGKTELLGGVSLYNLSEDEPGADIWIAAASEDQAKICFDVASSFVHNLMEDNPLYEERYRLSKPDTTSRGTRRIFWMEDNKNFSSITVATSGIGTKGQGIKPSCAIVDELHEHPDDKVLNSLTLSLGKTRLNPQLWILTNAGVMGISNTCRREHEYAVKVVKGEIERDNYFALVCSVDNGDDEYRVLSENYTERDQRQLFLKTCPLMGKTISYGRIIEQIENAALGRKNEISRAYFCRWTESAEAWMRREIWEKHCVAEDDWEVPAGRVYGGIDLSRSNDLTAFAWVTVVEQQDGQSIFYIECESFLPGENIHKREQVSGLPLTAWIDNGYLILIDDNHINLKDLAVHLSASVSRYENVEMIGYDPSRWEMFEDYFTDDNGLKGLTYQRILQGGRVGRNDPFSCVRGLEILEDLLLSDRLRIRFDPVLNNCLFSSAVTTEPKGSTRYLDRSKSSRKIDTLIAVVQAIAVATHQTEDVSPTPFNDDGFDYKKWRKDMGF